MEDCLYNVLDAGQSNAEKSNNIYLSKEYIKNMKAGEIPNVMIVLSDILEKIITLTVEKLQILMNANLEKFVEIYRANNTKKQ